VDRCDRMKRAFLYRTPVERPAASLSSVLVTASRSFTSFPLPTTLFPPPNLLPLVFDRLRGLSQPPAHVDVVNARTTSAPARIVSIFASMTAPAGGPRERRVFKSGQGRPKSAWNEQPSRKPVEITIRLTTGIRSITEQGRRKR
jgi:hypothetical protein